MALPTTNLTLHCDASDVDHLWTTYDASGVHTGVPSDGSLVQVWDDEGDGVSDFCLINDVAGSEPIWRSSAPLMSRPCLDWDGVNDVMGSYTQTGGGKALSSFITASAYTLIVACYPEVVSHTGGIPLGHAMLSDRNGVWGLYLRVVAGQRKVALINWSGAAYETVETDIAADTSLVIMGRHEAGNLYISVNGGVEVGPVAAGDTTDMTNVLELGKVSGAQFYDGRIGEIAIYNAALSGANLTNAIAYFMTKWMTGGGPSPYIPTYRRRRR